MRILFALALLFLPALAQAEPEVVEAVPAVAVDQPASSESHASEGGEHHSKGLPQFNPESYASQVFWLAVIFALLYAVFSKSTLPMIGDVLQTRERHIQDNLDAAQDMRTKAERAQKDYETALAEAQGGASALIGEIEKVLKQQASEAAGRFRDQSAQLIQDTETALTQAKAEALEKVQGIAAEIALLAADKIVGVSTDIEQAKTVVRKIDKKAA